MPTPELILIARAFRERIEKLKIGLGPQEFTWYPHDSFGSLATVQEHLDLAMLRALVGNEPVLDIGCGDGELTFLMESLGWKVDAIDHPPTNHNLMQGVTHLKQALESQVAIHPMDIDAEFTPPRDVYGLTLFLGILYHLKNPFAALEKLSRHSRYCLLSTRVAQRSPKGARMREEALAYLVDELELDNDESNYWIFSEQGLKRIAERSGWQVRRFVTTGCTKNSDPVRTDRDERAFCLLESRVLEPRYAPELLYGWHQFEGSWRWTEQKFGVRLGPDPLAPPVALELRFQLPAVVLRATGPITLQATVNGTAIEPQAYQTAGEHIYQKALPAGVKLDGRVQVGFSLDKVYAPGPPDVRQLGLQVSFHKLGVPLKDSNAPVRFMPGAQDL